MPSRRPSEHHYHNGDRYVFDQRSWDRAHPPQLVVKMAITIYEPGLHVMRVEPPAGVCRRRLIWAPTATPVAVAQDSHGFVALHAGASVAGKTTAYTARIGFAPPPAFVSIRHRVTGHPLSAVVGVARLTKAPKIRPKGDPWSPWLRGVSGSERLYALTDLRWLNNPIPASGNQGFWPLGRDAVELIANELEGLLPKITRRGRALYYTQNGRLFRGNHRPDGAQHVSSPELDRIRVRLSNGQIVLASEAMLQAQGDIYSLEVYP